MTKYLGSMMEVLREEELHILMEYAMNPAVGPPAQLVTGLKPLDTHRAHGVPMLSYMYFPLFTQLRSVTLRAARSRTSTSGPSLPSDLSPCRALDEAAGIVTTAVVDKVSSLLSITIKDIDPGRTISAHGVDSLVALELRTFIARKIKADLPVLDIIGSLSITQLCRKMASVSKAVELEQEKLEGEEAEKS